ncbi:MAG TPA: hypothetical protein VHO25_05535 [Polyangiaceae bacterium]|nr:hypothetical protein [Polyangiaceae bacterium]
MQRTMLGIPQLAGLQPGAPAAPAAGPHSPAPAPAAGGHAPAAMPSATPLTGSKTLMGMSAPMLQSLAAATNSPASAAAPATASPQSPKRTLIGASPVGFMAKDPGAAHSAQPLGGTRVGGTPVVGGVGGSPMSGVAPSAASGPPSQLNRQQTMVGVARPGIAPLHPGEEKKPAANEPLDPALGEIIDSTPPPENTTPWRVPTSALVLVGVCSALVFGAVIFSIVYDSPKALSASASVGDNDRDVLELNCDNCADGTKAKLGDTTITINNGTGVLPLKEPLILGNNVFNIGLERPGIGRNEVVRVVVPVQYRVHADYSGLNENPAEFGVVFQVRPGMKAVVDDEEIEFDETGRGSYGIDLTKRLQGVDPTARPVTEVVSYSIGPAQGEAEKGRVKLRTLAVPLWLESPGLRTVLDGDRFKLAGRTAKGGTVSVDGQPIVVNAEGRFDQMMSVDAVGETTIELRAQAPDHAPRWVQLRIKRVEDLKKEADLFRQTGTDEYGAYAQNIDAKIGMAVVADGVVEQSAADGQTTMILLDVQNGCKQSPCLVRLVHGGALDLKPRSKLSAFGRISRAVEGVRPGSKVPEIQVEFLLAQP